MGLGCTPRRSGSSVGGETLDASIPGGCMITVSALASAEDGRRAVEGLGASEKALRVAYHVQIPAYFDILDLFSICCVF